MASSRDRVASTPSTRPSARRRVSCATQELLDVLHEDVNLIQEKPYVPEPEDADEARDGLVAAARDALRRSRMRDKSLISDLFQGQLVAKKTCKVCARSSTKFEPFTSLSLPVPAPASRSFVVAVLRLAKHANGHPSLTVRVEAPRLGDVRDLKSAVAAEVSLTADSLTLCDVARHRIYRVLDEDTLPLGALGDFPQVTDASKRLLIAYERPTLELTKTPSIDFPSSFEELAVGQRLDALDHKRQWYVGTVVDDEAPCRDKNFGKQGYIRIRFDRFSAKWDECFCAADWPSKLQPPYSKSKGNRLAAFETCVVHRSQKKGLFGTPFLARVASDRSCRALKRAVLRQASLYNYEGSVSVISRDSLSDADIDLDSSDSCRCLSDRFFIALNWDSSSTYREPLSSTKLPPVPTSPRHYDLASCLSQFSREETLSQNDSWRCPRCKKSVEATSSIGLWRTPDVLVIHLKRFLCTARWREKLRTDISFPRRGLDLSKFLPADAYAVYDLFGVINHLVPTRRPFLRVYACRDGVRATQGSLSGGHYTAHVRVSPCSSDGVEEASVAFEESERWLHVDDDLVEAAKPEDVVTDGAYVLFYRRRRLSGRLVVGHTAVGPVAAGV
jgi:ubiquitin C-terminal hydrolase